MTAPRLLLHAAMGPQGLLLSLARETKRGRKRGRCAKSPLIPLFKGGLRGIFPWLGLAIHAWVSSYHRRLVKPARGEPVEP